MEQVEGAMDAGSSGEEAYRLLVSELKRELDTRVCGAVLQKFIVFRVGEGVPFSYCYCRFRTVVHDAKSDGEFAASFTIIQSIVSVVMSRQYPTLYEITFPRNTKQVLLRRGSDVEGARSSEEKRDEVTIST